MPLPALFANLRLPVIASPLFIISCPELVIAQCKAGIVGSFPSLNARPISQLDEWLHQITEELAAYNRANPDRPAAPFAVNQIVHKTNNRLDEDMAMCAKWQVPMLITSLGAREDVYNAAHSWGGIVLHDVINQRFAHKAIEKGADGAAIVHAVVSLGRGLGMKVTAEGVETADQHLFLRAAGVHYMQGFRFGRPMKAGDITTRLAKPGVYRSIEGDAAAALAS